MTKARVLADYVASGVTAAEFDFLDVTSGTADATTFLRGDKTWQVAGSPSITDGGNAVAMTINSSEQIGIGDTTPAHKLAVLDGTSSEETITNGIDLTKGGLVWIKSNQARDHALFDTERGINKYLKSVKTAKSTHFRASGLHYLKSPSDFT